MRYYLILGAAVLCLSGLSCGVKARDPGTPCVYVLSNPAYAGLYKVGYTSRTPTERADDLYTTGVPYPFEVEYVLYAADARRIERDAHRALKAYRVNPKREFFRADTMLIIDVINAMTRK